MIHWLFQVDTTSIDVLVHLCRHHLAQLHWVTYWQPDNLPHEVTARMLDYSILLLLLPIFTLVLCRMGIDSQTAHYSQTCISFERRQMTLDYLFFYLGMGTVLAPWVLGTVLKPTPSSFLSLDFCTPCVLYTESFELDKHISSYFLSFRCQLKCHFFYLKEQSFLTLWVLFCPLPRHSVSSGIIISAFLNWSRQKKISVQKLWY